MEGEGGGRSGGRGAEEGCLGENSTSKCLSFLVFFPELTIFKLLKRNKVVWKVCQVDIDGVSTGIVPDSRKTNW